MFWILAVGICLALPARGDVVETFQFVDVGSVGLAGDLNNASRTATSEANAPYTLGTIAWSGMALATPDPMDPAVFPSWGGDLGLRITHLPSGVQADLDLGSGGEPTSEPAAYAGASRALAGLTIEPGDTFTFEFLEGFDDPVVSPDAVWSSIEFSLSDDASMLLGPPGESFVRLSTIGLNTFPTAAGEVGAEFFRIEYGPGVGPAIAQIALNTHATSRDDLWFDSIESGDVPATEGTFQANFLDGTVAPLVSFQAEDTDPAFAGDFATLRLTFDPGDFTAASAIHFGVDTDGGFAGPATGSGFALLEAPLTFTVLLEDGTLVASDLWQVRQDVDNAAFVEVDVRDRTLRADIDSDGDVDGDDLLGMYLHFGVTRTATHAQGDTDGNGSVDATDVQAWRSQVGQRFSDAGGFPAAGVPEPDAATSTAILIGISLIWRVGRRTNGGGARRLD